MATINTNKNPIEIKKELNADGVTVEYIVINGVKCGIHGANNRWLGNNPEAIPTVIRWLRKHDIKCADTILTCNSVGYFRSSTHVEMPTVDGKKGI